MRLPRLLAPLVLVGATLSLTVSGALAQAVPARISQPTVGIVTPSGNISCAAYIDRYATVMRCAIHRTAGPDLPRPKRVQGCDWTGGRVFSLGRRGPARRIAPCDALADRRPQRLAYGTSWRHGPFRCLSSRLALLCTNATGNGVLLSYERQRVF